MRLIKRLREKWRDAYQVGYERADIISIVRRIGPGNEVSSCLVEAAEAIGDKKKQYGILENIAYSMGYNSHDADLELAFND